MRLRPDEATRLDDIMEFGIIFEKLASRVDVDDLLHAAARRERDGGGQIAMTRVATGAACSPNGWMPVLDAAQRGSSLVTAFSMSLRCTS